MSEKKTQRVCDYSTGDLLTGTASAELISQSAKVETGAVPAYRDVQGVWQYVEPSQQDHYRRQLRETVLTVFVEETDP